MPAREQSTQASPSVQKLSSCAVSPRTHVFPRADVFSPRGCLTAPAKQPRKRIPLCRHLPPVREHLPRDAGTFLQTAHFSCNRHDREAARMFDCAAKTGARRDSSVRTPSPCTGTFTPGRRDVPANGVFHVSPPWQRCQAVFSTVPQNSRADGFAALPAAARGRGLKQSKALPVIINQPVALHSGEFPRKRAAFNIEIVRHFVSIHGD